MISKKKSQNTAVTNFVDSSCAPGMLLHPVETLERDSDPCVGIRRAPARDAPDEIGPRTGKLHASHPFIRP